MKRKKSSIIITIIILAAIAAAVAILLYSLYKKNSTKVIDVFPVNTVSTEDYEDSSTYYATVSSGHYQDVPLRDGLITEINVKKGDTVKEGDLLMAYDKASLQLSLDSDTARIALLKSQIDKAEREIIRYGNLIPSEYAPEGSEETIDNGPLMTKSELIESDCMEDDQEFDCTTDTIIRKEYLQKLREKKYTVTLNLYEDDTMFGYLTINGKKIPKTVTYYAPYGNVSAKDAMTAASQATVTSDFAAYVQLKPLNAAAATGEPAEEPTPELPPDVIPEEPTPDPSEVPTETPTEVPTEEPTEEPTEVPTETPTEEPTEVPTETPTEEPTEVPTETPTEEPTEVPTVTPTTEPTEVPTVTPTITPSVTPTDEPVPTETPEPLPTLTVPPITKTPAPTPEAELYIAIKRDPLDTDWFISKMLSFNGDGVDIELNKVSDYYGIVSGTSPETYERYETEYNDPDYDEDSDDYAFSRKEIEEMIDEKRKEIESLNTDLKSALITYKQDLLISENGEVRAIIDGTVTELKDPALLDVGDTLIRIKGEENYAVTVMISELDLENIHEGDLLSGTSYESSNFFTASVTGIGDRPVEGNYWGDGNPNASYYPVNASVLEDDIELSVGEMCEVSFEESDISVSTNFLIPTMFIRSDERGSYVYKMEDDVLKKEYVLTGKSLWGSYLEIRSGLTEKDYIAFPYGTGVKEGAQVSIKDNFYDY